MQHSLLLATLLIAASNQASAAAVTIGSPAPAITLDQLFPEQPAANASLGALAGKAIVLEFWATWCAPCIDAIPHINELAAQFKDRPVQFISITDEEPSLVEGFLKKKPIGGWVGIDRSNQSNKAYGREGIPFTVLIDAQGKVAAITHPSMIKASHIEDLLAGRPLNIPMPMGGSMTVWRSSNESGPPPILDVLIRPTTSENASTSRSVKQFNAKHADLRTLIASAYGFQTGRIEGPALERTDWYDMLLNLPSARRYDDLTPLLQQVVCVAFGVKVERQTRETDVLVLKAPDGKPGVLTETVSTGGSMSSHSKGQFKLIGGSMSQLASILESELHRIVLDEAHLTGKYDIQFKYDNSEPAGLLGAIRKETGLTIEPARRLVEFLVVR